LIVLLTALAFAALVFGGEGAVPAAAGAPSCPAAVAPGKAALAVLTRDAPVLVRRYYRDEPLRDFAVDGVASLNGGSMSARELPKLRRLALHLCGLGVADRTWLLFLSFPAARSINTGSSVAFVVRTARGWVVWHRYFPGP
jgi:hypothetical protein